MPSATVLLPFLAATAAILVIPGPSVAYVVARGLEGGPRAAVYSVLGLEAGALLHVLAAAGGLGALMASTAWGLTAVRWAGAAYLVYLGIRQLWHRPGAGESGTPARAGEAGATALRRRLFGAGLLVDLLNPKTAMFFLAFLPQFVDPARGPVTQQVLVLGVCFVALAFVVDGSFGVLAGRLSQSVTSSSVLRGRLDRGTGLVYIGMAGFAVFA